MGTSHNPQVNMNYNSIDTSKAGQNYCHTLSTTQSPHVHFWAPRRHYYPGYYLQFTHGEHLAGFSDAVHPQVTWGHRSPAERFKVPGSTCHGVMIQSDRSIPRRCAREYAGTGHMTHFDRSPGVKLLQFGGISSRTHRTEPVRQADQIRLGRCDRVFPQCRSKQSRAHQRTVGMGNRSPDFRQLGIMIVSWFRDY